MAVAARLELICVGSELLAGQLNTHQARLGLALRRAGLSLCKEATIGDDRDALRAEISAAAARSEAVIVCGGLGPTFDDLTREATADALGRKLRFVPGIWTAIQRKFRAHKMSIPEENKRQAFVLEDAEVLENRFGSAPGQFITLPGGRSIVLLPGPTSEMVPMFERQVLPRLTRLYSRGAAAACLSVHLAGISESAADERLQPVIARASPGLSFTILSSKGQVDFHASVVAATKKGAEAAIKQTRGAIYRAVGPYIFGEADDTLEAVVGRTLKRRGLTVAVAESCTGGLVGARLTGVPGSSDYFVGGAIAYKNEIKSGLLGVSRSVLARDGAVSAVCARAMAQGARRAFSADIGLALTGIAGPSGGTARKPVGLVYVAAAGPGEGAAVRELRLSGGRDLVRARAGTAALRLLLWQLAGSKKRKIL